MKTDAQILREVADELKWDIRVEETDVGIEVDKGVVTLTGTVDSFAKQVAAEEAAYRVAGVLAVANDVQVRVPGSTVRNDTDIALAVRNALAWDVLVPEEQIRSTVSAGWVTLAGEVDTWSQREDAEHAIRRLVGVKGITNKLTITPRPVDTTAVRTCIEEALARQAEREVDRINLTLQNGTLVVSGPVHSMAKKRAVLGAAGHAPGVRIIEDHLRIDPAL
jgi:osmotically-inducible protein OsmY